MDSFVGRKPINVNCAELNPEAVKAGTKAVGPGIADTGMLFFIAKLANKPPGSDIPGEPASEQ